MRVAYCHYVQTRRHPRNRKYVTYRNVARKRPSSYTNTGNVYTENVTKFGRVSVVFEIHKRTVRQTDRTYVPLRLFVR